MNMPLRYHHEPHREASAARSNWLRAAVLGANDGIVSVAALVVGVAGATEALGTIFTAGIAGLLSGALSMAAGEYVSVSSQRDLEKALIEKELRELREQPEEELEELTVIYQKKGLSRETAARVAAELTEHDAFAAHAEAELRIDPHELTNPWHAGIASAASFTVGAIIPLLAILLPPADFRVLVTFASVAAALAVTGAVSARVSGARILPATTRVVVGGALAMGITYCIGALFGVTLS